MSDEMLPSEDPDLAGVWPTMSAEERLRYQLAEGEQVPDSASEDARRLYRDHLGGSGAAVDGEANLDAG